MLQLYYMMLLILTTFRPIEADKFGSKKPKSRKRTRMSEMEKAKEEIDYMLSIERAVERVEFPRLPEAEALPKDPKQWPARDAQERAQLERDIWVSELLHPNPGARPAARSAARRTPRYPSNPLHNITNSSNSNAAKLSKRLIEALDEEAIDPTLFDNYDDELKLVRNLKDRVGEKVLNAWRRRIRFRPPENTLRYSLKPLQHLELPVMMTGAMRSLLRRNERKLRQMSLAQPDTTPRWQPAPAAKPHAPPPSPSRRNYKYNEWLNKFKHETAVLQPLYYTVNPMVSPSWITKLWYYSTPSPMKMKYWAYRKMQESVYNVETWVQALDDVIERMEFDNRFNIYYTITAFETLLRDLRLFWTFLRHRFYLSTISKKKAVKKTWGIFFNVFVFHTDGKDHKRYDPDKASLQKLKTGRGARGDLGIDRSDDISRHLIYYTMAARRYVDLVSMSEQIIFTYHNRVEKKTKERNKRLQIRKMRAKTRRTPTQTPG